MKAQSAIEYLITYGWMVIALVAIVAVLFYLGIFNPATWFATSNEVRGLASFTVTDFTITGDGNLTLFLKSETGVKVQITGIKVNNEGMTNISPVPPIEINPGQKVTISGGTNLRGASGDPFYNIRLEIVYDVVGGGTNHVDAGYMSGRFS